MYRRPRLHAPKQSPRSRPPKPTTLPMARDPRIPHAPEGANPEIQPCHRRRGDRNRYLVNLPSAEIDGLDIDMTQAPQPTWLPDAIRLRSWNLFSPVPPDLLGKYDFVHVRLLVLVLSGVDPVPAIRNLLALLKPGGYLQWDELDCVHMKLKKVDEPLVAPALEEIRTALCANGRHNWSVELPRMVTYCGFEDPRIDYDDEPPELVRAFNDQHLNTMEEFARKLAQMGRVEPA